MKHASWVVVNSLLYQSHTLTQLLLVEYWYIIKLRHHHHHHYQLAQNIEIPLYILIQKWYLGNLGKVYIYLITIIIMRLLTLVNIYFSGAYHTIYTCWKIHKRFINKSDKLSIYWFICFPVIWFWYSMLYNYADYYFYFFHLQCTWSLAIWCIKYAFNSTIMSLMTMLVRTSWNQKTCVYQQKQCISL